MQSGIQRIECRAAGPPRGPIVSGDAKERTLKRDHCKQAAANRRNATKSTGPRTQQGKMRSRMNALRHGLAVRDGALWESSLLHSIQEVSDRLHRIDVKQRELLMLIDREMRCGSTENVVKSLKQLQRLTRYAGRAHTKLKV